MLDFTQTPVIDNHCHPVDLARAQMAPQWLAREFYHGLSDEPGVKGRTQSWKASDEVWAQIPTLGVVQTLVSQLSKLFGCEPTLEAVAAERNRRTAQSFAEYIRLLYADGKIVGTVVDSGLPTDDPALAVMPGRTLRLFQMSPALQSALAGADSYRGMLRAYQDALDRAVREQGFIGVKSHLGEEASFGVEPVGEQQAEAAFAAAKRGEKAAYKLLYVAAFGATMLECQELGVPVHLHAGTTGGFWDDLVTNADPFLLVPYISRPEFRKTKVVLLHGAHPWIQHATAVAHALPHVWVDLGWTTPWASLRLVECYRELIGVAPLAKLMIGSGGHNTPEIAWLAAKTAKIALAEALGDAVRLELLVEAQADRIGRMILHDNAARLYGLSE